MLPDLVASFPSFELCLVWQLGCRLRLGNRTLAMGKAGPPQPNSRVASFRLEIPCVHITMTNGFVSKLGEPNHTVDGRNPAPPKKAWIGDSPVNAHKHWFPLVSKWCERISSIHSLRCAPFGFQSNSTERGAWRCREKLLPHLDLAARASELGSCRVYPTLSSR